MIRRACAAIGVLYALSLPAAAQAASAQPASARVFALGNATVVQVNADGGDVVLAASGDRAIHVDGISTSHSGTLVMKTSAYRQGRRLVVTIHGPPPSMSPFSSGSSQRYRISYPAGVRLDIRAFDGNVTADDLAAPLELYMSRGNLLVRDPRAPLTASTDAGTIAVAGAHAAVDVLAEAGNVEVSLASDWRGPDLRMQSDRGNLSLAVPAGIRAHVDASTQSGTVTNAVPSDPKGPLFFLLSRAGNVTVRTAP